VENLTAINPDWLVGGLAIAILMGSFLMMFTSVFTTRDRQCLSASVPMDIKFLFD